jgi:hypothetical protein
LIILILFKRKRAAINGLPAMRPQPFNSGTKPGTWPALALHREHIIAWALVFESTLNTFSA